MKKWEFEKPHCRRWSLRLAVWLLWPALLLIIIGGCHLRDAGRSVSVTMRAVPATLPDGAKIYVAGNHPKLGDWQAGAVPLQEQEDGSWQRRFTFTAGTHLEFKFTRGKWETEAVGADGIEFPNSLLEVIRDTTAVVHIPHWRDTFAGRTVISRQRLENKAGNLELFENWRYHPGDDLAWASPAYSDSAWQIVDPRLPAGSRAVADWRGAGWFRLHLAVDSTLWNMPLAMHVVQRGASEVYLNGALLYRFGEFSTMPGQEQPFWERNPRYVLLASQPEQVLAVRYSNHQSAEHLRMGGNAGFEIYLGELNPYIADRAAVVRTSTTYQMVFSAVPLAFALMHLLLFLFYPPAKENLYYALSMAGFAMSSFASFEAPFATSMAEVVHLGRLINAGANLAVLFGVLTVYASTQSRLTWQAHFIVLLAVFFIIWSLVEPFLSAAVAIANYAFFALACAEMLRIIFARGSDQGRWEWAIGFGFVFATLAIFYQVLINLGVLRPPFGVSVVYVYGILILAITVSIRLSHNFASVQRNLARQLAHVRELSQRMLEQERHAREEEIARRLLEADNARKTRELEDARDLQLSMLPQQVPKVPQLEIAAFTQPATEVGGDYYDFSIAADGTLTVVIGDATGHGARAGTMVTVTKSLFHELADAPDILSILGRYNQAIKRLKLGMLYMALALIKIKDHKMVATAAGMPPILIYRAATKRVTEVVLKGMPLGSFYEFPYQVEEIDLAAGDTIVLMSDGFPEMFNEADEMLDYDRARELLHKIGDNAPEEIIARFSREAQRWAGNRPHDDDMTFVVLQVKP